MGEYINKKVGEISDLVKRKFKEVKKGNDYEKIYTAGQLAINEIVKQIKDDKSKVRGEWALAPLLGSQKTKERGLINEFKDSYKNVGFWENMFGENAKKISLVANKIDNAENETLKRLAKNRTVQDSRQLVKKSGEQHKNKPMFVMEGGNDYRKQTGNIIFTEAANPVRIDQALKGLFTNPNVVYEIDYSGCDTSTPKGKAIKEKMTKLIGTKTCYLGYDSNLKTYVIRDPAEEGKIISQRAYIWEGVKLIPAGIRQWQSYVEEKKGKGKLGEETVYNAGKLGKLTSEMLKDIPSLNEAIKKGELTTRQAVQLCQKTEIRLNNLLKKARELGYELEPECVTKKWVGNGHMELHLNNGSSSVSWTVWGNDGGYNKDLGKDLDEFIDDNEEEYKTYLTKRVQSKWLEFDSIAKTEITDVSKKGGKIGQGKLSEEERKAEKEKAEQHKNQVLIGIGILEQTVNNYDKGGNLLAEMKKLIRNAKVSIGGADVLDDNLITKNFIEPIREKWVIFKNLRDEYGNPVKGYANQHKYFKDIFLGNRDEQVIAMRELGRHGRVLDNTETSHLAETIAGREDIGIKDAKVGECLDKIKNWTAMSIYDANGNINQKVKGWYDNTYASAKKGTDSLITLFVGRGWLPKNWKDEEKEVRKCMDNLKDKLNSINDQCNNISLSIDDMIKTQHEKRLKLEQKDNKTEEDMKVLQGLVYLEENPNKAKEIYKDVIEKSNMQLKYGDLGQVVKAGLLPALGELGGGITSNNDKIADIYNDIKGYGFWNLSDENAKLAGEILTEIVITVAVAVVTGGIGGVAMAAILRGGSIALRAAKWTSLANKVLKVVQISQKGYKGLSIGAKVVKSGYRGASLLIEGTTFNAASTMIHSAMNGTSLDALNLNPVAKENIQTAAFLGALSVSGKLTQGLMKLGGKTKLTVNLSKGLEKAHLTAPAKFTTGLVAEMGSMLAAEQAVNFTFGHDVIDPETGEVVTSRAPTLPTQQEMIQMIGMILAFKAVKPGIWAKYEQKLNNGTLEICRGTGKNQVLIRDPQTGKVENVQDLIDGKESTKGNQGKSDGKAKGQIEKGKKSTSSEKVQKAEEELNGIRDKITGVEARIKRIDGQIKNFEASREISNRERLAKDISKRRTYSENGNKPSDNIPINDHYEGRIIDGKIEIIDKRTGKINTVEFDAKKRINDLLGNDKELEKLDIEIAERMILGIKNGHVEVGDIAEARKIKNGYPDKDLEIVGLENGKVGVRKKTNIQKLRQQKAELDNQLKGLESERKKKRTALNKEKESKDIDKKKDNTEKTEEGKTEEREEIETKKSEESENKRGKEQLSNEIKNEIKNKIPDLLKRELKSSINSEFSNNPELHQNFIKTKILKNLINYVENITKSGKNLDLIDVLKGSKEELSNLPYEQRIELINNINSYIKSTKIAQQFISYESLGFSPKELFLRAIGKNTSEINKFEGNITIEQFRNSVVFIFEKASDVQRFFGKNGNGNHFENKIQGLDTIVVNKENCKNAEKIGLKEEDAISRVLQHESQHAINEIFMPKDVKITYEEAMNPALTDINTVKKYALNRAKNEIVAQYTNRLFSNKLSPKTIAELSKGVGTKEGLINPKENGPYDYFRERKNTQEGKKALEEYKKEVEKMCDYVDETLKSCKSNEKIQDMLNMFCTTDTKERKNIKDIVKSKESETKKPEDIEKELDELLSNANKGNYEKIKLDWVTKAQFEAGVYIEGIHRRFKKFSLKPNTKLPKEFLRKMGESLKELKAKCRGKLSEKYKKFVDKYNQYIERKLAGEGNEVEIKEEEIRSIEEIDKSKIDELSQFQEGETIELWVKLDEDSSFLEIWRKEKNGYREMEQKLNGKIKKTRKVITTEEMASKMKDVEKIESLTKRNEINGTDSPEVIAEKLEESLDNSTDFEVSQEAFVSGKFIEGIKNRFNKIIQRPNVSLPRESVKRLSGKIKEMMDRWGNKLSDNYRNLTERFSRYLNDLLKQTGEKIKIKEQQRMERKEQQRKQQEEQQKRQIEEQQRGQREGNLSNEITNEIRNKIPDLLKREQRSSISSEFSNNPELHQNFIKTKVLKNLINYVENITKSGKNPDLIEVLKGSKEELSNISYEQRTELINNINSYLKSVETASRFINIEKSGGVSTKELFLRAKGLDASEIKNFEGNVTIEQFRNSIVFVFEKSSDVQRFFKKNGAGNHFENKIPGLDTIVINKEYCKNAEKIGLKEEDAISRTLQHESQHAINEIFMPKNTNTNILEDALNRVKNEIVAQYTSRIIFSKLSPETIAELSKRGGIKETLLNPQENGPYDYFRERKNTPEGKKAREEYNKEVEKMCDYIDETLKSCKSNEEIQNMLNMFCTTDIKERKNIKDTVKSKEGQQNKEEKETGNGQLKASDIEYYDRGGKGDVITSFAADLGNKLLSDIKKRGDVVAESRKRLCIIIGEKTCFIESGSDGQNRKENIVICVNKILPKDLCKTIFEKGKIFEMGPISAASHINEIIAQERSAAHTQGGEKVQQEKIQREQRTKENKEQERIQGLEQQEQKGQEKSEQDNLAEKILKLSDEIDELRKKEKELRKLIVKEMEKGNEKIAKEYGEKVKVIERELKEKLEERKKLKKEKIEKTEDKDLIHKDILSSRGIKNITKIEMDTIQHILKNTELSNIINQYIETGKLPEGIEKEKTIQQINQEIENIETTINTIQGTSSNLKKIKNFLFYMKQNILGRQISNLGRFNERVLAMERQKSQTKVNEICKKYEKLLNISENIVITEDCDLKIIDESLKDLNRLPKSTLQKIKDNGIMLFFTDKAPTELGFNLDARGKAVRGWPDGYKLDNVGAFAEGKIVSIGRDTNLEGKYISNTTENGEQSIVLHELGHAFDSCTPGEISRTPEFIEFHKKFYDKISSYEQQGGPGGEAGCSEFFAESTARFFASQRGFELIYGKDFYEYMKKILV